MEQKQRFVSLAGTRRKGSGENGTWIRGHIDDSALQGKALAPGADALQLSGFLDTNCRPGAPPGEALQPTKHVPFGSGEKLPISYSA